MACSNKLKAGCRVSVKFGELIDPAGGFGANANGKKKAVFVERFLAQ